MKSMRRNFDEDHLGCYTYQPCRPVCGICVILILTMTGSCSQKYEEWQARVVMEDGIPHVYNPETPFWGADTQPFELSEILGINEEGGQPLFTRP